MIQINDAQRREFKARPPNVVAITFMLIPISVGVALTVATRWPGFAIAGLILGVVLMQSPRVAQQWERATVLRLGRFVGLRGPGLFFVVPFVDAVATWIDQRTITTSFAAEQTLTSDTVPVNVDASCSGWCMTRRRPPSRCRTTRRPGQSHLNNGGDDEA